MALTGLERLKEYQPNIGHDAPVYSQSQGVIDAQNQLNKHNTLKPGEYQSQYQGQIDSLINNILNRPKFNYDMNHDPLYNQYKQQYVSQGHKAMRDTQGQAAMLSGGYGNSYATAAGNQAYNDSLSKLNSMVPQLQQNARQFYDREGDRMAQNVGLLQGQEDSAYGRYRDTLGDWRTDRDYYTQLYDSTYGRDYGAHQDRLGQWNSDRDYLAQLAQAEQNQANWQREFDFKVQQAALAAAAAASRRSGGGGGGDNTKKTYTTQGAPQAYAYNPKSKKYAKTNQAPSMWFDTIYDR